jgi:hypothetical protein
VRLLKTFRFIVLVILAIVLTDRLLINNPENWGNYEACLKVKTGMADSEVVEIMGPPDFTYEREDEYFDVGYGYGRYEFASSSAIAIQFTKVDDVMVVKRASCEDRG